MLSAIIVGPSEQLSNDLRSACAGLRDVQVYKEVAEYPASYQMAHLLNSLDPDIVFVEVGSRAEGFTLSREIRAERPDVSIIGFGTEITTEHLRQAQEAGITELVQEPFAEDNLQWAILESLKRHETHHRARLLAFVPAKAGSGASTAALGLAGALVSDLKQHVLAIDADLHSGILASLLDLDIEHTVVDALESAQMLDDRRWRSLILASNQLDLLPAPRSKNTQLFSRWHYYHLLAFARARYETVIVDLPEVVNDATQGIVEQADKVMVVCTSETPSLLLARRRIVELQNCGTRPSALEIVLTRYTKGTLHKEDVEKHLQRPISFVLPNDYADVQKSILVGRPVHGSSDLAKAFRNFAQYASGQPAEAPGGWVSRWFRK
jgi:pilus assembly protein CpaE